MESFSSSKRTKIAGAVIAATLLVVVGVVALNHGNAAQAQMMPLEHAQQLAQAQNANTPLANLPDELQVQTPEGWEIESDEPVGDSSDNESVSEDSSNDELEQEEQEHDEDIDSPMMVEQDEHEQEFVAELDENVIVDGDESQEEGQGQEVVAADGKRRRCYKNLKACGAKKACVRKCRKRCKPYAKRTCYRKKFCRCFCKYYKNIRRARKCIIYKRNVCVKSLTYLCKRRCTKFCKKIPRCYCCPKTHIRRKCRKMCRRYMYRSKCKRCRCIKVRCYNMCRLICIKKY